MMANQRTEQNRETMNRALSLLNSIDQLRTPPLPDFRSSVKNLVIIGSSSRGGSSIFTEILRCTRELVHFRAEINPFLLLSGLTYPESGFDSDQLSDQGWDTPELQRKCTQLGQRLAFDAGLADSLDLREPEIYQRFVADLLWRLVIQWPFVPFDCELLSRMIDETFSEVRRVYKWSEMGFENLQLFHALLLCKINALYPEVNPYYYDLDPEYIRKYCKHVEPRSGPPGAFLIEEPPFVPIYPWRSVTNELLRNCPLIIKTPSNAYRLPFLKRLFPNASVRILHLVRNPGAAINGLYDGWRFNGFFSHRLSSELQISGYTDVFSEWGTDYWKFDLPPGWRAYTNRRLEEVCGFQWRSSHQAILDFLHNNPVEYLRVRFEDVVGSYPARAECFTRIAQWLGIDPDPLVQAACRELPPVMATSRPRQRRWFRKVELLTPVLDSPPIIQTTERLGYEHCREEWP